MTRCSSEKPRAADVGLFLLAVSDRIGGRVGLTLVETMVAVTVMVAVMATLWKVQSAVTRQGQKLDTTAQALQAYVRMIGFLRTDMAQAANIRQPSPDRLEMDVLVMQDDLTATTTTIVWTIVGPLQIIRWEGSHRKTVFDFPEEPGRRKLTWRFSGLPRGP